MFQELRSHRTRATRWMVGLLGVVLAAAVTVTAADPASGTDQAKELVAEALHNEIYGHGEMRAKLLAEAADKDPDFLPAKWHRGLIQFRERWVAVKDLPELAKQDPVLIEYRARRDATKPTVDDQLALANWCRHQGLAEQERAHLWAVLAINPRNAAARKRLGFKLVGDVWVDREDLERLEQQKEARRAALERWTPKLRPLAKDVRARQEKRRAAALAEIRKISDVDAIPGLEEMLSNLNQPAALAVVDALATMPGAESSLALARQGLLSRWPEVRGAAAQRLKKRPFRDFVPLVLATMRLPAAATTRLGFGPMGKVQQRVLVHQEDQSEHNVAVVDKAYVPLGCAALGLGFEESMRRALLFDTVTQRLVTRRNMATEQWNQRVVALLSVVTGQSFSTDPRQWWDWWTQQTERQEPTSAQKPVRSSYARDVQYINIRPEPEGGVSYGGDQSQGKPAPSDGKQGGIQRGILRTTPWMRTLRRGSFLLVMTHRSNSCLAKGTLVHAATGLVPIEQVRVGDLMLSQDPDSGQLALKPVVALSRRPALPLLRLHVGSETFTTTGGHLFWVSGSGWIKVRQLRSGMQLHTVDGPVPVRSVEPAETAVTYNLIVADFNTYFVGKQAVLSHDVTRSRPTSAVVPGLSGIPR